MNISQKYYIYYTTHLSFRVGAVMLRRKAAFIFVAVLFLSVVASVVSAVGWYHANVHKGGVQD